jgi:AcrR family transcriptional regulator
MESLNIDQELLIPAGRHTLPAEEVAERQRERLLRAMASCASELGYQKTTVGEVVRIARTSRTAFYEHFADKEACFLEAYRQMTAAFISASLDAAASVESWEEKLDAGIVTYFEWMAQHPETARSTVIEIHQAGPEGLKERSKALKQWIRTLEGVAVLARRSGAQLPEIDQVAFDAIILVAEAYVHDYARRGCVERVGEKAAAVQALARVVFEHGVSSSG